MTFKISKNLNWTHARKIPVGIATSTVLVVHYSTTEAHHVHTKKKIYLNGLTHWGLRVFR